MITCRMLHAKPVVYMSIKTRKSTTASRLLTFASVGLGKAAVQAEIAHVVFARPQFASLMPSFMSKKIEFLSALAGESHVDTYTQRTPRRPDIYGAFLLLAALRRFLRVQ